MRAAARIMVICVCVNVGYSAVKEFHNVPFKLDKDLRFGRRRMSEIGVAMKVKAKMEPRSTNRWQHRLKPEQQQRQRDQQKPSKHQLDSDRPSHGRHFHQVLPQPAGLVRCEISVPVGSARTTNRPTAGFTAFYVL
jgi:hypothetical protein